MLSYWLNGTINLILPNCFPFPTQKNKPPQLQTEGSFLANISQVSWATLCCVAETAQPQSLVAKALAFLQRLCWYDTFANAILEKTLLQRSSWQDLFACLLGKTLLQRPSWKGPFAKALLATPFHKGGHMRSHMHAPIGACTASLEAILQRHPHNACKWHPFAKVLSPKGAPSKAGPSKLWLLLCSDSPSSRLACFCQAL